MTTISIISALILGLFIIMGVCKFGLLKSYSAYAKMWNASVPIHNANLWSIVTIVAALMIIPAMIDLGEDNPFQVLGFATPIYLIIVGLTPEWEDKERQHVVHTVAAIVCACFAIFWMVAVAHSMIPLLVSTFLAITAAGATKRYDAYIFWGEMICFMATYLTLIIGL